MESHWKKVLLEQFQAPYMKDLKSFLQGELASGKIIFPHGNDIFKAYNSTPFPKVKAIIIGQDPYHGPRQAHGLSFSVQKGIKIPPSLVNIYKELESDLNIKTTTHGNLESWAKQGVLLLNTVLTVEKSQPASHHNRGWEYFTNATIQSLSEQKNHLVFFLWGSPAQKKASLIDAKKHLVLKAPHPSPLSAYRGFFGCKHFSKCNEYLTSHGLSPIDWQLPLT